MMNPMKTAEGMLLELHIFMTNVFQKIAPEINIRRSGWMSPSLW